MTWIIERSIFEVVTIRKQTLAEWFEEAQAAGHFLPLFAESGEADV